MQQAKVSDPRKFILAGRALFTLRSAKTGKRFTFKVVRKDSYNMWHVRVLAGPDNTADYNYIGFIGRTGDQFFAKARGGKISEAPSVKAFRWFLQNMESKQVEVWHEGRCGRCGRALTVPESIEAGLGAKCQAAMGR